MNARYCRFWLPLLLVVMPLHSETQAVSGQERLLKELLAKIDGTLLERSEQDIRAWLDARIRESGDFGLYSFGWTSLQIKGDLAQAKLNRGAFADAAAQFFRAYEMLGDRKYLEAGLKTADFYLQVQQPAGHFPTDATIQRNGKASAVGEKHPLHVVRMEDGYQFRPFCLLLYAYKLTGERKYLDGALRCGELVTQRIQHPAWGWCPTVSDTRRKDLHAGAEIRHGNFGVEGGGSYADYCTTDGFRISVILYHLTKDKKHLVRSRNLGKWLFATQLGHGKVRGWADNYGPDNKPLPARNFEGLAIDPRNFNRFTGPPLVWLYAMSGQDRFRELFEQTYEWMRSVERQDGWAAEYTYDGHPAWTQDYRTYRHDQPQTWPDKILHTAIKDGRPWYGRDKVQLRDARIFLELLRDGGRRSLRAWFKGSIAYTPEEYLAARLAAAKRCTDETLALTLQDLSGKQERGSITANYLQRVRLRLAAPDCPSLPSSDSMGRTGLSRQSWHGPHTWFEPYRPPLGWASWQFVRDARLALGKIEPAHAALGGRGLENQHIWEPWDVMGDWTTRCVRVGDWMEVPLFVDAN